MEHLALWHDNRFGQCVYFLTALMNMLQRHHVAREVRARIMNSKKIQDTLAKDIFVPGFKKRMQEAIQDPDTKDAKALRKMLQTIILTGTSNCPFSPGERRCIQPRLFANCFFFGVPNIFNTIAPDNFMSVLLNRKCISPKQGNQIVTTDKDTYEVNIFINELKEFPQHIEKFDPYKAVASNSLRAVMYFNKLVNDVASILYGIPWTDTIRKTIAVERRKPGVFAKACNAAGVNETGGRAQFHTHHLVNAGVDCKTLSEVAEYPELRKLAVAVLDSQHRAEILLSEHEKVITRLMKKKSDTIQQNEIVEHKRAVFRDVEYFLTDDGEINPRFYVSLSGIQALVGRHMDHLNTCHKPPQGLKSCRMKFPRGSNDEGTRPIELEEVVKDHEGIVLARRSDPVVNRPKKKKVEDIMTYKITVQETEESKIGEITSLDRMSKENVGLDPLNPFPPLDKRYLVWELRRRTITLIRNPEERANDYIQYLVTWTVTESDSETLVGPLEYHGIALFTVNPNGRVVDYNAVQTMALRCNTSVNHLGSDEQAKAALFYVIDYFSKDGALISNALSYALTAKLVTEKYPGEEVKRAREGVSVGRLLAPATTDSNTSTAAQESKEDQQRKDYYDLAQTEAKKFCNAFLNHVNGGQQLSITQCAAALMGYKSFRSSYSYWSLYPDAAIQYVVSTYNNMDTPSQLREDKSVYSEERYEAEDDDVSDDDDDDDENVNKSCTRIRDKPVFVRNLFREESHRLGGEIQLEDTSFIDFSSSSMSIQGIPTEQVAVVTQEQDRSPDTTSSITGQPAPKKKRQYAESQVTGTTDQIAQHQKSTDVQDNQNTNVKPLSVDTSALRPRVPAIVVPSVDNEDASIPRPLSTSRTAKSGISCAFSASLSASDVSSAMSSGSLRPVLNIDSRQQLRRYEEMHPENNYSTRSLTPSKQLEDNIEYSSDVAEFVNEDEVFVDMSALCKDMRQEVNFGNQEKLGELEIVDPSVTKGRHGVVSQHVNYM